MTQIVPATLFSLISGLVLGISLWMWSVYGSEVFITRVFAAAAGCL